MVATGGRARGKNDHKERKTVRNFQGVPKNLRHVSFLGGGVRATGGKKTSN